MPEFTAAERTMLTALASEVVVARFNRLEVAPSGNKGRLFFRVPGPETPAEKMWFGLMADVAAERRAAVEARLRS